MTANCTDAAARGGESRILDPARRFSVQSTDDAVHAGDKNTFEVEKTAEGFRCSMNGESLLIHGHDFLLKQNAESICVGVMAAGKISVKIKIDAFTLSQGGIAPVPEGELVNFIPDYPFERQLLAAHAAEYAAHVRHDLPREICAAPQGRPDAAGTQSSPVDLQTALSSAGQNGRILLRAGVYAPELPYLMTTGGASVEADGSVILDGGRIREKLPLMILRGSHWSVNGLEFRNSPSNGIHICGSHNQITGCKACGNKDTGMLICAYPGSSKEEWPENNRLYRCESFRNCDDAGCNADGFGAKLSVGAGNCFEECTAHHNIDDGFDLYTRANIGAIGAVTLKNCTAYQNGTLDGKSVPRGTGFKMGGEFVACPHEAVGCVSCANRIGFDANSNPVGRIEHCSAFDNAEQNYRFKTLRKDIPARWSIRNCFPPQQLPDRVQNLIGRICIPDAAVRPEKNETAGK